MKLRMRLNRLPGTPTPRSRSRACPHLVSRDARGPSRFPARTRSSVDACARQDRWDGSLTNPGGPRGVWVNGAIDGLSERRRGEDRAETSLSPASASVVGTRSGRWPTTRQRVRALALAQDTSGGLVVGDARPGWPGQAGIASDNAVARFVTHGSRGAQGRRSSSCQPYRHMSRSILGVHCSRLGRTRHKGQGRTRTRTYMPRAGS